MRTTQLLFTSLLITTAFMAQQSQSGIYMTFSDYRDNKMSFSCNCSEHQKIKLHETFSGAYVSLKYKGQKIKLFKDSIYAVQNCDQPLVRFQNRVSYILEERSAIWIFSIKETERRNKETITVKKYFFCQNGYEVLIPLTVNNIKLAFPKNDSLYDLMDALFKTNDASDFDSFHNTFKINYLLNKTKSK